MLPGDAITSATESANNQAGEALYCPAANTLPRNSADANIISSQPQELGAVFFNSVGSTSSDRPGCSSSDADEAELSVETDCCASSALPNSAIFATFENDIGCIIYTTVSAPEVAKAVATLSIEQKYRLLRNHSVLAMSLICPVTFLARYSRSFRAEWFIDFDWLAYSTA